MSKIAHQTTLQYPTSPLFLYNTMLLFRELGLADRTLQNRFEVHAIDQYADSLLRAWINEEANVPTGGATWENLKTALQSIGCDGAANQI